MKLLSSLKLKIMKANLKEAMSFENLEEEINFAMIEKLNQLSKTFWDNLRVSCILESLAVSNIGMRISRNISSLLGNFFTVKNLWVLECQNKYNDVQGFNYKIPSGKI
jgi:hypothetical protein